MLQGFYGPFFSNASVYGILSNGRLFVSIKQTISLMVNFAVQYPFNISNNGERKLVIYYICDTRKISRDKWIAEANRLQTTYGGGLTESALNSHCG